MPPERKVTPTIAGVEGLHGNLGDGGRVRLVLGIDTRDGHGGLQQGALEEHAVVLELRVHGREHTLLDASGRGKVVVAIDEDLRLDDGDEARLLADARVASEVMRGHLDREVGRAAVRHVDLEARAPLGEARALRVVLRRTLSEGVEAGAPGLARAAANEGLEADVDLDGGMMPFAFSTSTNGLPFGSFWKSVSSYRMAPEMNSPRPAVVKRRLRQAQRFASVFSMPFASRRLPTVPVDSSQASRPLPLATMAFAVLRSSAVYLPS